jgi:hypothetical protein
MSDRLEPMSDRLEPMSDRLEPMSDRLEPMSDWLEPIGDWLEPISFPIERKYFPIEMKKEITHLAFAKQLLFVKLLDLTAFPSSPLFETKHFILKLIICIH